MSADRNIKSQYPNRWGSSGSTGDRDDKSQQSASGYSNYQRHRQQSGLSSSSNYHGAQSNRPSRDSYSGSGAASGGSYYDYSYKSNRPYYQSHNYRHQGRPNKSSDSYVGYHRNYKGPEGLSSSNENQSTTFKPNTKPNGFSTGSFESTSYYDNGFYERRGQRYNGSADYRRNPEETSDHYYPQRDRRTSLASTASKPNRVESTRHSNVEERSVSPLNSSDPYSDSKLGEGYRRKPKPSLIPSNFKEDKQNEEDDDDYELESALKDVPRPDIRQNSSEKSTKVNNEPQNEIQQRISEQLPLTLEHKEELDEEKGTTTRQSSEESAYELEQPGEKPDAELKEKDIKPSDEKIDVNEKIVKEEENDNYEPEIDVEAVGEELVSTQQEKKDVQGDEEAETKVEAKEVEPDVKVEKKDKITRKKSIVPLQKIETYIFPMTKVAQRVWELKNHPREDIIEASSYLLKRPIKDFEDYPFLSRNLLVHEQGFKLKLLEKLSVLKGTTFDNKISLWNEYSHRSDDWNERCVDMESQLGELYPKQQGEGEEKQQQEEFEPEQQQSSRRGRYHGDTVRSEAEFLEILKNLEKEKEADPLYKAELLAAKIPDMILNPVLKNLKHTNVNNLVTDKEEWAKRMSLDRIDTFTKHEHEMFCEAFLSYPKRFGRISTAMGGLRTPEECVLHYYKTKKTVTDYKQLLASKKKRNRKGKTTNRRVSNKSKNPTSSNTSVPNTPAVETPIDSGGEEKELALENFIPKENPEEVYTETGRRRRAAAPVFDSSKGPKPTVVEQAPEEERKPSVDNTSANETQDEDTKVNKAPQKKKARGIKAKKREEVKVDVASVQAPPVENDEGKNGRAITSYWSVKDMNHFVSLVGEFGTQWSIISERMKTKSTTMVRNYFYRNADAQGLRSVAEAADRKNLTYPNYPGSVDNNTQVMDQQSQLKKPPLGVFSSHGDLPSNVQVSNQVKHESSILPSVKNLAPFPQQGISLQPLVQSTQPLPQPQVTHSSSIGGSTSRSNPFSITSLLNPSEESKPSLLNPAPPVSTFTEQTDIYAKYRSLPNGGGSSVINMLNNEEPKPFNPLSTLVTAASGTTRPGTWPLPQQQSSTTRGESSFDAPKFDYSRDNLPLPPPQPIYQYTGPYLNRNSSQAESSTISSPGMPSNFRNILLPTPGIGQSDQNNGNGNGSGMRNDNNNNNDNNDNNNNNNDNTNNNDNRKANFS